MLTADGYTQLTTARLFDSFNRRGPWHLALWTVGSALAVEEVAEYSDLTREGAFPTKDGLKYVAGSTEALIPKDAGAGAPEFRAAINKALEFPGVESDAGTRTLRHLAERVRDGYLSRWAEAARATEPPGVEASATLTAAHLLDSGFSSEFLHSWLRDLAKKDARTLHVADVFDEAALLCRAPLSTFEVCVPFEALPEYPGAMPDGWLSSQETARWLELSTSPPEGDHRQAGSVVLPVRSRDAWSAVETVSELVAQITARAAVARQPRTLRTKGVAWLRDDPRTYSLTRAHNPARLLSLREAEAVYRIGLGDPTAIFDDALELFSALASGTRGASLTGGWAAVEGLLLRRGESPHVVAADRLAAIVACAFPRAELTALSYRHRPPVPDSLTDELADVTLNVERCRVLEEAIRGGTPPTVTRPSDQAMLRRVEAMVASPADKLRNVQRYTSETVRRLYTQRNLIMHAGSFQSVTLRATLRTAPRLVAAGIDRLIAARLREDAPEDPLALATRAEAELGLLGTPASRKLSDLLEPA